MAWRRHTRNLTKEVFYDGTTIDGSRLEKGLGEIEDGVNSVKQGDTKQRFVQTQYHAGFSPTYWQSPDHFHHFPWLKAVNSDFVTPALPEGAPYNRTRFKGTKIPGLDTFSTPGEGGGDQYAWTRVWYFSKPVVLHSVSVMMHVDGGTDASRPYPGYDVTAFPASTPKPYSYTSPVGAAALPPAGFVPGDDSVDVPVVLDVMNPGSPEDAELTDVEFVRSRFRINQGRMSLIEPAASGAGWVDMSPPFDSTMSTHQRPLQGRLVEHTDLNIPLHERSRVRLSILIPMYADGGYATGSTANTWGALPWYLQGWSVTLSVLEEVRSASG